jgi:TIR domain
LLHKKILIIVKDGYKYHLFISYARSGDVPEWLKNHFLPVLTNCLDNVIIEEEPQIFVDDEDIEIGSTWPDALADALHRSYLLLAIWSPQYWRSKWCVAEWHSIRARATEVADTQSGLTHSDNSAGLVYPILYSGNPEDFPEEARWTQYRRDLRSYTYPYLVFRESLKYLEFHDKVKEIARDLAERLPTVPPWDPHWVPRRPDPALPLAFRFQRL